MQDESILLTGGLILVVGTLAGILARVVRLPTLTGYLAAGIALGGEGFDLLPHQQAEQLARPVTELTMAFVLFVLGGQFRMEKLRGRIRRVLGLSAIEAAVCFAAVTAVAWPLFDDPAGASLLGVMAIAVAPATTLVVLQEYHAEGPISDTLQLLTALSNVWSVVFFELGLLLLAALSGGDAPVHEIAWQIVGSLLYGVLAGHALILLQERFGMSNYALPLLTILLTTIGLCHATNVPFMLAFLVTGSVVANRSSFFDPINNAMESFAQPAYVAFFVLSGWHIDFSVLADSWLLAGLYIVARTVGKLLGVELGLRVTGLPADPKQEGGPPLGLGLVCQAGAAIALAHLASRYDEELGRQLLTVILGSVAVFELVGPLLVKRVVLAAGEVQMGRLIVRPRGGEGRRWLDAIRRMLRGRWAADEVERVTVEQIMRRGIEPLPAKGTMDEVLRYANHSPFNQFPVVDDDGTLTGMVRLKDLSELVYDPQAAALVIADDLVSIAPEQAALRAGATITEAASFFSEYAGNTVPVVDDRDGMHYRGVVERAEVLRTLRTLKQNGGG